MHLRTEEPAVSWVLEPFGEVGEMFLNTFHRDKIFVKTRNKKLSREKVLKTLQLEFVFCMFCFFIF